MNENRERFERAKRCGALSGAFEAIKISNAKTNPAQAWFWAIAAVNCGIEAGHDHDDLTYALGSGSFPDLIALTEAIETPVNVIVTRHKGVMEWLARHRVYGQVVDRVTRPEQVESRIVYGILPLHLACLAREMVAIDMPDLPMEMRGQELTADEMDKYGAKMVRYKVRRIA